MTNAAARTNNLARVLEALLVGGAMTRASLGSATGLSKATVARLVTDLEDRGVIESCTTDFRDATQGVHPEGPGRKPTGLRVPRSLGHVIGFSLGLRSSHAVALDLSGNQIGSLLQPTPTFDGVVETVEWAAGFVRGFRDSLEGCGELLRVCVAIPGRVRDGMPIGALPKPLDVLTGTSLGPLLGEALETPSILETDADMALAGVTARGYIAPGTSAVLFTMSTMLTVATRTQAGLIGARTAALGDFAALPIALPTEILEENNENGNSNQNNENGDSNQNNSGTRWTAGALLSVRGITDYAASRGVKIDRTDELWSREDPAAVRLRETFVVALESAIRVAVGTTDPEVCVLTGRLAPLASVVVGELRERLAAALDEPPSVVVTDGDDNGLTTALGAAKSALLIEQRRLIGRVRAGATAISSSASSPDGLNS